MNSIAAGIAMTTEELLALPEDGTDRWLIQGQLRERSMTVRNRWHSRVLIRLGQLLGDWLDRQPEPRGELLGGEAGVRLRRDPDTTVGVDLIYITAELAAQEPKDTRLVDGVPILAVEILSPSDTENEINEKVAAYLSAGVPLVWVVDPHDRTVLVYRPGEEPELFNAKQDLSADPHLSGFRVPVAQIFTR
ncbi:MAG: Uma2 family endonuclease [Gemmataceae bacterium]|nr:Uma2 family endonuclease [Gemmataceae bacterium]